MTVTDERFYHVTTLSNFARAFDKYTGQYCKSRIPQSSHPRESYVLPAASLSFGVAKASRLVSKLAIPGDAPLVLQARLRHSQLHANNRTGIGLIWPSPDLPICAAFDVADDGVLGSAVTFEDTMARSLELHAQRFGAYESLSPRSLSFLPVARGCQASCPFCFSESSVSAEQTRVGLQLRRARLWADFAQSRGAQRAVITGGGEPTLLPPGQLTELVRICGKVFPKTVLITNGAQLASPPTSAIAARLHELADAGLSVLAVSRHHASEDKNAELMRFRTMTSTLLETYSGLVGSRLGLACRLVCVLQRGGVASEADVQDYVSWAASFGVEEVCFKELYVSTSRESVYFSRAANAWSAEHQVPLSIVQNWAEAAGLKVTERLPWGAPIFSGTFRGQNVRVAAYTEPSLFWERSNGLSRSWNVMANGECLASLEDRRSVISMPAEHVLQ